MRKIRFVKVVIPEIVAYYGQDPWIKNMEPEYRCECGMGIDKGYTCCPYCGSELDWKNVSTPSKKFLKLLEKY